MSEPLVEHQKRLDRLNHALENLRQAMRDKTRAQDQEDYWRRQVNVLTALLEKDQVE